MKPAAIGTFQVERELGRGGMGEVYLARDTRLDRPVAIKALPGHLAQDPDRLARFQREAKVLASLSHPGIGGIYGLEETEGRLYLVLEYVDGETLSDRLTRGPIPVDEALSVARHIAEALEAAHEKGVIHRDVKPGNVMVTSDGVVKVLDFGLARSAEGVPGSSSAQASPDSPTVTSPVRHSPTIPGAIMGTAGYMSPEQARGKPVDKRSDIFSFGCVLFEMLTGAGPFPGETLTDSLGAILHREPNWSLLPPETPTRVRELLATCLAKDRRHRLHDIADARLALERAIGGLEWIRPSAPGGSKSGPGRVVAAVVGGAAMLGIGWTLASYVERAERPPAAQPYHVSTAVPSTPEMQDVLGIAPDARFVIYRALPRLASDSTKPEGLIGVRRLDRDETSVIEGSEGVMDACVSPDGRSIAFTAARDRSRTKAQLKKVALDNGRPVGIPQTLCDLPPNGFYTVCWSSDREIVLANGWAQTILAVPASGGEPRVVLREPQTKEIDVWGELRPLVPGKSILASRWALVGQTIKERTEVVDLASGKRTPFLANAGGTQLVGDSIVVARRNPGSLIAARLDPATLQVVGEPVTVWNGGLRRWFFISANGTLAMTTRTGDVSGRRLMWIDDQGQPQPVGGPRRAYGNIAISPDGTRVATTLDPANDAELPTDIWIQDLTRGTFSRIPTGGPAWDVRWSRDGTRIAYATVTQDEGAIWERDVIGAGDAEKMYTGPAAQTVLVPSDWSPDGNVLAILQVDLTKGTPDVYMLEKEAGSSAWKATAYLASPASEELLRFSPDGKWVRFISDESGRPELYVQPFTGPASGAADARRGRRQISTGGAMGSGWWSPDGKEIRYADADGQMLSVQIQTEPALSVSPPKPLFSIKDLKTRDSTFAPDGRMMVVLLGENEQPTKIDLIVNFMDEVRGRLDAK